MTEQAQQNSVANHIWALVSFCAEHGKDTVLGNMEPMAMFRYLCHCYFTGKLAIAHSGGKVEAVMDYWPDFVERIEAKFENNASQFEWSKCHKGDALFVGDVIGRRESVGRLWQAVLQQWPHLVTVPVYTLRHEKLKRLPQPLIERFIHV